MRPAPRGISSKSPAVDAAPKKNCLSEIQRLQRVSICISFLMTFHWSFVSSQKERDERRKAMEQAKQERLAEEQRNREMGTPGDVDFQRMIRRYRENEAPPEQKHTTPGEMKICVCVRKRPISQKEIKRCDYDSVTCINPLVLVHDCKFKVDGISKYLDNSPFEFDHTFHEDDSTDDIYIYACQPLVDFVLNGGRATVFAYGQTGSGKTYTMQGL
jgi:kinesin family protein 2/24